MIEIVREEFAPFVRQFVVARVYMLCLNAVAGICLLVKLLIARLHD